MSPDNYSKDMADKCGIKEKKNMLQNRGPRMVKLKSRVREVLKKRELVILFYSLGEFHFL